MEKVDEKFKKLKGITKTYQIADIYLLGSRVSDFQHPESDFDIAVRFKKGLPDYKKTDFKNQKLTLSF